MKLFDKIYCINLDSRSDRWEECLDEFKKIGIENDVERVSAFQMTPGIAGCTKSHLECIKLAKLNNYNSVLILEDDVTFTDNFTEIYNAGVNQLLDKSIKYDMLYFSANLYGDGNYLIDDNLAKISSAKAGHAYIVNSSVYDIIINAFSDIQWNAPHNWHHGNPNRMNMDTWYKNIQQLGNVYGIYPSLAEQRPSHSDLLNTYCDYGLSNAYNKILEKTI